MVFITNEPLFLASVVLISLSGVLMPGPLFAMTVEKAYKRRAAGALISIGHAVVEVPLIILIFFVLSQFRTPSFVQIAVGLIGGLLMVLMGIQTFRNRNKTVQMPTSRIEIRC